MEFNDRRRPIDYPGDLWVEERMTPAKHPETPYDVAERISRRLGTPPWWVSGDSAGTQSISGMPDLWSSHQVGEWRKGKLNPHEEN